MFDVSSAHSFNRAKEWVNEIRVSAWPAQERTDTQTCACSDRTSGRNPSSPWWATRRTCRSVTRPRRARSTRRSVTMQALPRVILIACHSYSDRRCIRRIQWPALLRDLGQDRARHHTALHRYRFARACDTVRSNRRASLICRAAAPGIASCEAGQLRGVRPGRQARFMLLARGDSVGGGVCVTCGFGQS